MSSASSVKAVSFHLPATKYNGHSSHPTLLSSKAEKGAVPSPTPEAIHSSIPRSPVSSAAIGPQGIAKHSSPQPGQRTAVKPATGKVFVKSSVKALPVAAGIETATATESSKEVRGAAEGTGIAHELRQGTNTTSHDHIRRNKYQVARLREQLLRVEEEVKHTSRGRHTLELAIQDIRKALSVSQQSMSAQQKKMRGTEVLE